ncbi:MAG TPA: TonB-dependent receptor [Halomonas sp.]|nr:TonB-dependent receptor [Halomonas sp.]
MLHSREKQRAIILALALAGVGGVQAAEPSADTPSTLDTMVVLGSGQEVSIFDSPASVSTLGPDTLRRSSASSAAELLRDVPGVQIFDNGSPGMQRIRIRGEDSRRVTIQIDGHALTDHSPHGTPLLLDPSTIERIEVVRGPSSVLSGSNAIGGVVNIITRRGGDQPLEGSVTFTGRTASRGGGANATLQGASGDLDWRLSAGLSDDGDRRAPDGRLDSSGYSHDQVSTHLGYRLDNHYLAVKADQYRLDADVYSPLESGIELFQVGLPRRDLRKVALFYEGERLSPRLDKLEASLYYQTVDRLFESQVERTSGIAVESTSDDTQTTYGLDVQADLELTAAGKTLVGLEYEHDALDTKKDASTFMPFPPPGATEVSSTLDEAYIETFSAYAQQAWALSDATTLYLGARGYSVRAKLDASLDKDLESNSDERLLGSLSLVHHPTERWSLRANLAQGYSYPTLEQLFLTTKVDVLTKGNSDLSPESANTLELGARYRDDQLLLDATLFHTRAKDYIGQEDLPSQEQGPSRRFVNIDKARTTGLELLSEYTLPRWDSTTLYLSGSLLQRELDYGTRTTTDSGTPQLAGNLGVRHEWPLSPETLAEADFFVRAESSAKLRAADGEVTSRAAGYGTLNAYLGLRHGDSFDLGLSLGNLLDKSYEPYGEIPGAERNASLRSTFYF